MKDIIVSVTDKAHGRFSSEDGKVIKTYSNQICYSFVRGSSDYLLNKKVKYLEIAQATYATRRTTRLFIEEMEKAGFFPEGMSVSILTPEQEGRIPVSGYHKTATQIILKGDLDKVSTNQMFFAFCILRTLQNFPGEAACFVLSRHIEGDFVRKLGICRAMKKRINPRGMGRGHHSMLYIGSPQSFKGDTPSFIEKLKEFPLRNPQYDILADDYFITYVSFREDIKHDFTRLKFSSKNLKKCLELCNVK